MIEHVGWEDGWNFGTSFATPRVAADIVNFFNETVAPLISSGEIDTSEQVNLSNSEYASNSDLDEISEKLEIEFTEMPDIYWPASVLSDDVSSNIFPGQVNTYGYPILEVSDVRVANNAVSGSVQILGERTQGSELIADTTNLSYVVGLGDVRYQWSADGETITGATSDKYTLVTSDVGKAISVTVNFTGSSGNEASLNSAPTSLIEGSNSAAIFSDPAFTGSLISGNTVTTSITYSDPDGNGDNQVITGWFLGDIDSDNSIAGKILLEDYSSLEGSIILQSEWAGKKLYFAKSFFDDYGNFEDSSTDGLYEVGLITAANSAPAGAINIIGALVENSQLTADTTSLADADGLGDLSYRWLANGIAVEGATAKTLTLGQSEVGKAITVAVSYTDAQGTSESLMSAPTSEVENANDTPTGTIAVSGTLEDGSELTADTSNLDDVEGLGALSYQWLANGDPIADANGDSFTLGQSEVGKTISVAVSFTDGQGTLESLTSAPTSAIQNINDAPILTTASTLSTNEDTASSVIAFSATDVDGDNLTYSFSNPTKGSVTNNGDGTYTYTPDANENGSDSFTITVSDGTVDVSQTVDVTINAVNDAPSGLLAVTGTEQDGSTLTITNTLSDVDGLGVFSYQWLRDGELIFGSTSASYTLTQDDVSTQISVTVSYNDQHGTAESVTSAKTNAITGTSGDVVGGLNIEQLSKTGDVVTYGLIADASYDLGGDGIGALDFAINFDVTNFDWVDGSLTSDYNWSMVLPNETEASSGVVKGGFIGTTKFTDFSNPIAEFQMTVLETSEPVAISITGTSIDGGAAPDTIETFSYMSSTLTATVITRDGTAMDGVAVTASDNSQTTDSSGQLSFEVSNGSDVVMDASFAIDDSATSAINSMDALQALRIAVGLDTSNGPATYEDFIAADIDGSGSVNSMDALNILKYAVGLDAPDPHWVFIDSAADHSAIKQTSVNYDTGMTLEGFSADASVSLTGILVGDIDDSYSGLIA